jgi:hypothetical protein
MLLYLFYFISNSVFLPLQKVELEKEFGDLIEPSPIEFSMNTIGWKISFGLLIIGLISFIFFKVIEYRRNKYRRMAMKEFLNGVSRLSNKNSELVNFSNLILKRLAIDIYGREEVANLYGLTWIQYLDSKSKLTRFEEDYTIINNATYNLAVVNDADCKRILTLTKKWIRTHAR